MKKVGVFSKLFWSEIIARLLDIGRISNISAGNGIRHFQNTQNIMKIANFALKIDNSRF